MKFDGVKVFDPRDGQRKISGNPALILGDILIRACAAPPPDVFWPWIADMANGCDEEISVVISTAPPP